MHIPKGRVILKEHRNISILYGILLIISLVLCVGGSFLIPITKQTTYAEDVMTELVPTEIVSLNEDTQEYHFRGVDWSTKGNCLHFVSSHFDVSVKADDTVLFTRNSARTLFWGDTTGFAREYIEIPNDTTEVTVTLTACYPEVRSTSVSFYQGFASQMFSALFRDSSTDAIISILNACLGIILIIYGILTHKRSSIGGAMVYLGIFTVLLGIWSILENAALAFRLENRAACSFTSYTTLSLLGIPFIMFIRRYLQTEDKYVHKILLAFNLLNIILVNLLQILGVADMKQTLPFTHIAMVLAVLYLPFTIAHMIHRRLITRRFWVTICSLLSMVPPLAIALIQYYSGSHNVSGYANIFVFVFILIFAVDVSHTIIKDIDAGKEAAIFRELAEKDLLTACYNRNAYRSDTAEWENLQKVLLLTCDLNDLKRCNDTLGHTYGDQYITDAATLLKKVFSDYGKIYRIGGDEFCIIIPDRHKCNIASLLAELTEEQRIYNAASPVIYMQIACGYAIFDEKTDKTMEDIRIRADERMYAHKKELKLQKIS
jgi:diguanylate cyclase (GGDEF)-like protein